MIVVDSNILAYYHLKSEFSEMAFSAYRRDPQWVSPVLWRSEFQNVLAGYLRKKLIQLPKAKQVMEEALELMLESEFQAQSHKVLDLISTSACSSYDCEYVALAMQFDIPLLTNDKRILSQFPGTTIGLKDFVSQN